MGKAEWINPAIILSSQLLDYPVFLTFISMSKVLFLLLVAAGLASCTAARDGRLRTVNANHTPQLLTTIVDCSVYVGTEV